jgi:hypothetical protein
VPAVFLPSAFRMEMDAGSECSEPECEFAAQCPDRRSYVYFKSFANESECTYLPCWIASCTQLHVMLPVGARRTLQFHGTRWNAMSLPGPPRAVVDVELVLGHAGHWGHVSACACDDYQVTLSDGLRRLTLSIHSRSAAEEPGLPCRPKPCWWRTTACH